MIDTQAIRTRILHLALQGKLVPQNSSDDSAIDLVSALCKKIKGQSFQNNISQQEIPYDIPDSWVWCHLSDIGTTNIGLTYHPEDVSANGTIVARSSNIVNNKMDYTDLVKVTCPIRDNQFLHTHDILICARNGSKALVGKCAIFEGTPKTVAFGAFMAVFRTPLYRFVYYYFNSQVFKRNFFNDESKQINQVTQSILKKSLIPIPPMQEQERITRKIEQAFSILDTIDELQAQYAENITALKSKLIDAAIRGKLTEQLPEDGTAEELYQQIQEEKQKPLPEIFDEKIPFDIPDNWKWVRFSDVLDVRDGTHDTPKYVNEGIPLVTSKNLKDGQIDYSSAKLISNEDAEMINRRSLVDDGDILLAMIGTIGNPVLVKKDRNFCIKNVALFKPVNPNLLDMMYVLFYLIFEQYVMREKARGGLQPFVSLTILRKTIFPLPPLAEQKRIVQKLEQILPLCE